MAIYKISELIASLKSASSDGFDFVAINEIDDDDDDDPAVLSLDFLSSSSDSESDMIDAVTLPSGYHADLK